MAATVYAGEGHGIWRLPVSVAGLPAIVKVQDRQSGLVVEVIDPLYFFLAFFSRFSFTRNSTILRMSGKGNGWSIGNWIDPFAILYFESSLLNASTGDGVG